MELMRYEPWLRITRPDWLLRLLGREALEEPVFGETDELTTECFVPAVDIKEKDTEYLLEAEIPGMKKEDITIDVKEGVLSIHGERKYEHEETKENFSRVERCYGTFNRSFTLPDEVEADKIDATYKDGILKVTLPKNPTAAPKQIDVKIQ